MPEGNFAACSPGHPELDPAGEVLTEVEHVHASLRIRNRTRPQPLDHRYRGTTRL